MVKVSEHSFAIFTELSTSNPTGFCHVEMDGNGKLQCCNKNCNRKSGRGKQVKTKSICLHLHVLMCVLKLPEQQQEASCSSASSTALDPVPDATDFGLSVSRTSSINWARQKPSHIQCQKSFSMHAGFRKHGQQVFFPRLRFVIFAEAPYQMDNVILARDAKTSHTCWHPQSSSLLAFKWNFVSTQPARPCIKHGQFNKV